MEREEYPDQEYDGSQSEGDKLAWYESIRPPSEAVRRNLERVDLGLKLVDLGLKLALLDMFVFLDLQSHNPSSQARIM